MSFCIIAAMAELRKTLSLKGPRRTKKKRLVFTKRKPLKIVKPRPTKTPTDETNPAWQYLLTSSTFRDALPMAIGFFEQANEHRPEGVSRNQLRLCLRKQAHTVEYLEATLREEPRFNFDGSPAAIRVFVGDEKELAVKRINDLLAKKKPPREG